MKGNIYKNRHNDRIITIDGSKIGDTGVVFVYDTNGKVYAKEQIENNKHWILLNEEEE